MSDNMKDYRFDLQKNPKSIIKVIGVGGGGSNAVNHMFSLGIKDVEFVVVNTDAQALKSSPVPLRLQLGANLTEGLGAGANPEQGKNAAIESEDEIRELLADNTKMVFITAGMGGGTGTGAAPVVARVAKELNILTVGIVTAPFMFEGRKKMNVAQAGIEALRENCDTVLVILNDKLREIYGNLAIRTAFSKADDILSTAARSIAEIITVHQDVNVDFEDVKTVMKDAGAAVMGSSTEEGEGRAIRAAGAAISSPLLNNVDIKGAEKILLSIMSGEDEELSMDELSEITEYIQEKAGDNAEVIFGQGIDPELNKAIRVTVIATGFAMDRLEGASNKKIETAKPAEPVSAPAPAPEASTPAEEVQEEKTMIHLESGKSEKVKEDSVPGGSTFVFSMPKTPAPTPDPEPVSEEKPVAETPQKSEPTPEPKPAPKREGLFSFMKPKEESKPEAPKPAQEKIVHDLFEEEEAKKPAAEEETKKEEEPAAPAFANDYYEQMKQKAIQRAHERFEKLKGNRTFNPTPEELKEKMEVPAYQRKNVVLNEPQHSSEPSISKYNLNDDNEILGNNRFLHDNVD
ncbi:cell division protein FtsZ [Algoriphagus halophytocola]|uniref:Cell division protein FtsZ n=1 Tax=Algoriphagus halophytocola TaxID=2991499 RepID=A0ABY6MBR2_9BACT|nr:MULTISPECIES: cell division protein FtsZ [unclassified Algoriphagus]UZD21068.1 cell division protein FtsZ [Algoriphagus sp. TR-M5]WBL42234.1 cell division protein FtsZ [Algoriphagus sp. TR-M9]